MESDAILPSSPPSIGSANLPNSPSFDQLESFSSCPKSSSPPPLFSSEDSRESIDVTIYASPRIYKSKRKGMWWNNSEQTHGAGFKKAKTSRNFDSGVYMMSDAADSFEDMPLQHKAPFESGRSCHDEELLVNDAEVAFNNLLRVGLERNLEVYEFRGLDLTDDNISQIGNLASIIKNSPDPGSTLPAEGQYRSMIPELYVDLSQNRLCRLTPTLFEVRNLTTLILRSNSIKEMPQQIKQLRSLITLDVSLNEISSLPFDMLRLLYPYGSLKRLVAMGNPLLNPKICTSFLEMISEAPKHSHDFTHGNSLLGINSLRDEAKAQLPHLYKSLDGSTDREKIAWRIRYLESWINVTGAQSTHEANCDLTEEKVYTHHPALPLSAVLFHTPRFFARSPICFSDQAGRTIKGSLAIPESDEGYPLIVETNRGTYCEPVVREVIPVAFSRIASLLTTSLHNAFEKRHDGEYSLQDIRDMLPEPIPHRANAIIDQAIQNERNGFGEFRECHLCQKRYIVPRAQWIEFWIVGHRVFYPFKVSVCSWGCVPKDMVNRLRIE